MNSFIFKFSKEEKVVRIKIITCKDLSTALNIAETILKNNPDEFDDWKLANNPQQNQLTL